MVRYIACVVTTIAFLVCTLASGVNAVSSETADTTSHTGQVGSLRAESGEIAAIVCNTSRLGANRTQDLTDRFDWMSVLHDSFIRMLGCLGMNVLTEQRVCGRCTPPRCPQALCSPILKIIKEFYLWILRSVGTESENAATRCSKYHDWVKSLKHEVLQVASEFARVSTSPGHPQLPLNTLSSAVCHVSLGRNILTTCRHLLVDTPCQDLLFKRVLLGFLHDFPAFPYYVPADIRTHPPGSSAQLSLFSNASSDDLAPSLGCWEPELTAAASLFSRPGRWDVSMRCIDVLQVIARQITEKVIRTWLLFLTKIDIVPKSLHSIFTLLPRLFDTFFDTLFQKALYPIFNRLKKTAERRNQQRTGTSTVTVSCGGMKGRSRDVYSSLVRLYRITIINELSLSSHASQVAFSALNIFLPCLVETTV